MDECFYNESDGTTNIDKNTLAALGKFNSNYELIVAHHITANSKKQALGVNNKKCRFCARSKPAVTFKQVAREAALLVWIELVFVFFCEWQEAKSSIISVNPNSLFIAFCLLIILR